MAAGTQTSGERAWIGGVATRRYTGVAGVLYLASTAVATGLAVATGTTEQEMERAAVDSFLPAVATAPDIGVASMLGYVVSLLFLQAFAVGLFVHLGDRSILGLTAPVAVLVGATLFLVETLLTVGIILEFAPAYTAASGSTRTVLGTTAAALLLVRSYTALVAGGLVAVGALLFGRAIRQSGALPGWLGSVAVGLGVLGLVGVLWPLVPAVSYLRQAAYFLFALWAGIAGMLVFRGSQGVPPGRHVHEPASVDRGSGSDTNGP